MARLRVCVIFGGRSGEHEVSLRSARSVLEALDRSRYDVTPVGITHEGHWLAGPNVLEAFEKRSTQGLEPVTILPEPGNKTLFRWRSGRAESITEIDVAFPVLHGTYGEDGTIQGLFEMADMAYVGAGVLASAVAMDKALFKRVMQDHRIPVAEGVLVQAQMLRDEPEVAVELAESAAAYPLFVKPANLGSSVGVSKCPNRSTLYEGLVDAARYDRRILVERGIDAREIEVSVLGNEMPEASLPGEVIPGDEFYSYRAKYLDDTSKLLIPAPLDQATTEAVRKMAVEAFKAIDGAGMARVDFLLERSTGRLILNEINTIPGFTSISMYPKLWEASGVSYPNLMDRLIDLALARQRQKDGLLRTYGGAG